MQVRSDIGKFHMAIGSRNAIVGKYLDRSDDDIPSLAYGSDEDSESDSDEEDDDHVINDLFEKVTSGYIDLDEIMVSASHAKRSKGVDAIHLAKVWKLDVTAAKRTSTSPPSIANAQTIRHCRVTTQPMTACYATATSVNTSLWTFWL
jgi:hypothetical protein